MVLREGSGGVEALGLVDMVTGTNRLVATPRGRFPSTSFFVCEGAIVVAVGL
jgi:hypothetical protein